MQSKCESSENILNTVSYVCKNCLCVDEDVFKVHPSNSWSVISDAPFIVGF